MNLKRIKAVRISLVCCGYYSTCLVFMSVHLTPPNTVLILLWHSAKLLHWSWLLHITGYVNHSSPSFYQITTHRAGAYAVCFSSLKSTVQSGCTVIAALAHFSEGMQCKPLRHLKHGSIVYSHRNVNIILLFEDIVISLWHPSAKLI